MARQRSDSKTCAYCKQSGYWAWTTGPDGRWALCDAQIDPTTGKPVWEPKHDPNTGRTFYVTVPKQPVILHGCFVGPRPSLPPGSFPRRRSNRGRAPMLPNSIASFEQQNPQQAQPQPQASAPEPDPVDLDVDSMAVIAAVAAQARQNAQARQSAGGRRIAGGVPIVASGGLPPALQPQKPKAPKALPTAESLLSAEDLAAWDRYKTLIQYEQLPMRVFGFGLPGTGKTETPWRIAQARGWQHIIQQYTEETPATDILGHYAIQGGDTVWVDGSLGRAIRASHTQHVVYTHDEIGRASADAFSACLLALTNPESLRLPLPTGEVLAPKPEHWHTVATSNDPPNMLPVALADRLFMSVELNAPSPDLVNTMVTAIARRMACAKAREYSIRALLTFDRLVGLGESMETAARMVWEPIAAKALLDAASLEG